MKRIVKRWIGALIGTAFAACALLPVFPTDALAQGFVTGSANTDGFSLVGLVRAQGNGRGKGFFTIIVHRDVVEGVTAAAVCDYKHFDSLVISGNTATFHSVGMISCTRAYRGLIDACHTGPPNPSSSHS